MFRDQWGYTEADGSFGVMHTLGIERGQCRFKTFIWQSCIFIEIIVFQPPSRGVQMIDRYC